MIKVILTILGCYLVVLLLLYLNQRQYIYFPSKIYSQPQDAGVPDMREVTLHTADHLHLIAWYKKAKHNQPTIVYFHGNMGHIGQRGFIARTLIDQGFGMLLVSYRGYSQNPGKPTEQGLYQDGRAALAFLEKAEVQPQCIVLYGESIGTGVVVQLATEKPLGALILQSPFTSLAAVGQRAYRIIPVKWLLKDQYDSLSKAKRIAVPTLVIYAKKDWVIPADISQQLFNALAEPKQLITFAKAGHNSMPFAIEAISTFLATHVDCTNPLSSSANINP